MYPNPWTYFLSLKTWPFPNQYPKKKKRQYWDRGAMLIVDKLRQHTMLEIQQRSSLSVYSAATQICVVLVDSATFSSKCHCGQPQRATNMAWFHLALLCYISVVWQSTLIVALSVGYGPTGRPWRPRRSAFRGHEKYIKSEIAITYLWLGIF